MPDAEEGTLAQLGHQRQLRAESRGAAKDGEDGQRETGLLAEGDQKRADDRDEDQQNQEHVLVEGRRPPGWCVSAGAIGKGLGGGRGGEGVDGKGGSTAATALGGRPLTWGRAPRG